MFTPPPDARILTYSETECYKECPTRHALAYLHRIRRMSDGRARRIGSTFHEGQKLYRQGYAIESVLGQIRIAYTTSIQQFGDDESRRGWDYERELICAMLAAYAEHYGEGDPLMAPGAFEQIEEALYAPIINPETGRSTPTFIYGCKIDGRFRHLLRALLAETKTTGEGIGEGSDFWDRKRIDPQAALYTIAARANGHDVDGVFYDVIRRPGISPLPVPDLDEEGQPQVIDDETGERVARKDGKGWIKTAGKGQHIKKRPITPEEWFERVKADMLARPEFYFVRREMPVCEDDIAQARAELWQTQQAMRAAERAGRFLHHTKSCGFCDLKQICHARLDPACALPEGFQRLKTAHPELESEAA